ncbi:unnamed protein product [Spirodela intermedia]|uniref:Uncharacterized protein n=1 Tax=Spirodela intermedia TaxID=51605 RepID=A0A7I8KPV0_SPIIN|nr:unnamed protein product [Spirodela intermedia]
MAMARTCRQNSTSQLQHPINGDSFPKTMSRVSVPRAACAIHGGARASSTHPGGDFAAPPPPEEKRAARKAPRAPRRLITISTSDGRWHGEWSCDYVFTLRELGVADVAEGGQGDTKVLISLVIHKHAGFGFSVEGRIGTSFTRKCSGCFTSYIKEIDTSFNVWVLPSSRSNPMELPEIGSGDPSVIYVKPGSEADLDSLIRDVIRLAATANAGACSEACEKSTPRWNYIDNRKETYDKRWARLLEIRDVLPG